MCDETSEQWRKMSLEELELQYSPSRWSKRYSAEDIIPAHVKVAEVRSKEAVCSVPSRRNVSYGTKDLMQLDIFGQDLPDESPVLLYVHGGYWQELHKDLSAYLVKPLHDQKVVVVVVGYELAPQVSMEVILEEIRAAVSWVCCWGRSRGTKGVVLAGWSAGAQLVTQVLSTWPTEETRTQLSEVIIPASLTLVDLILGLVTFSGVFDLRPLVSTYVNKPLHLTDTSAWMASPLKTVAGLGAWPRLALLVAVGQNDSEEFKRQSAQYVQAFVSIRKESADQKGEKEKDSKSKTSRAVGEILIVVESADHFSIVEDLAHQDFSLTKNLLAFISNLLKEKSES